LYRVRFAHEELVTRLNASERAVALEKAALLGFDEHPIGSNAKSLPSYLFLLSLYHLVYSLRMFSYF
jgi:hypothetical protein